MSFQIDSKLYADYILRIAEKIRSEKDYITALDAATGDGDHWINMNMGFEALAVMHGELAVLPLSDMLKKIGMTLMSVVGGSSGVLYGSAYLAMAKTCLGKSTVGPAEFGAMLDEMLEAIMKRGNSAPGQKTMIDTLYSATQEYNKQLALGTSDAILLDRLAEGARIGAASTLDMPAIRGRASYQANKGVGHLDPGAVTMQYQLEMLSCCIRETVE